MLVTPKTVGRSIGAFAAVVFLLPVLAAFWLDSFTFDGCAICLLALSGGITNRSSLRCGVLAQAISFLYGVGYGVWAVVLCFFADGLEIRPGLEISVLFRILAAPVSLGVAVWAFWNVGMINRFVKGKTMSEPEEERAESVGTSPVAEGA